MILITTPQSINPLRIEPWVRGVDPFPLRYDIPKIRVGFGVPPSSQLKDRYTAL